jgi:hypothetical protein
MGFAALGLLPGDFARFANYAQQERILISRLLDAAG